MIFVFISLVTALAACGWTTAYAWTDTIPSLLWLDRARREDAWLDTIDQMHASLAALNELDAARF